jgi:hypothetical protein
VKIQYAASNDEVLLGDEVTTTVLFMRRAATVEYVPGVSAVNPALEHNGLKWVGLKEKRSGTRLAALVDPATHKLDRKIRFVGRGAPLVPDPKDGNPFLEEGEEYDLDR